MYALYLFQAPAVQAGGVRMELYFVATCSDFDSITHHVVNYELQNVIMKI